MLTGQAQSLLDYGEGKILKKTFYTTDGKELSIEVPEPGGYPSFYVFSIWKAGSTMLDGIIKDICFYLHIPIIDVSPQAFMQGIDDNRLTPDICQVFVKTGYCYTGFRCLPSYLRDFDFQNGKKILLVRDPRDCVVSHYFSTKYSHEITRGDLGKNQMLLRQLLFETGIDTHAGQISNRFKNAFDSYNLIQDDNLRIFRYEDIVFSKKQLLRDIVDFLELDLSEGLISEIAGKYDIFPESEDVNSHVRKVTPGDYKEKLKLDTIRKLNECFKDILLKYQYHIEDSLDMHWLSIAKSQTFLNSLKQYLDKHQDFLDMQRLSIEKSQKLVKSLMQY